MKANTEKEIERMLTENENANMATVEGRDIVARNCKDFYNLIEEDVYNAGKEWMLEGMYNDLCTGNFSEPFMCQRKKETFRTIVEIYKENVAK